jgi:hypothetical protein
MGWQCPGCDKCYAPWMPRCDDCGSKITFTDISGGCEHVYVQSTAGLTCGKCHQLMPSYPNTGERTNG